MNVVAGQVVAPTITIYGDNFFSTSVVTIQQTGAKPLARVVSYATGGGEPKDLFFAPIDAVEKLLGITVPERGAILRPPRHFAAFVLDPAQQTPTDQSSRCKMTLSAPSATGCRCARRAG